MQGNVGIANFIPLLVIFGIFYFLVIKPQQKKQKDHQAMVKNLKKNDEIITAGGIHATVIQVKDKTLGVRIDENVKIEIDKTSVSQVKKIR